MQVDMTPKEANKWYCDKAGECLDKVHFLVDNHRNIYYDSDWPTEIVKLIQGVEELFEQVMPFIELGRAAREELGGGK